MNPYTKLSDVSIKYKKIRLTDIFEYQNLILVN